MKRKFSDEQTDGYWKKDEHNRNNEVTKGTCQLANTSNRVEMLLYDVIKGLTIDCQNDFPHLSYIFGRHKCCIFFFVKTISGQGEAWNDLIFFFVRYWNTKEFYIRFLIDILVGEAFSFDHDGIVSKILTHGPRDCSHQMIVTLVY